MNEGALLRLKIRTFLFKAIVKRSGYSENMIKVVLNLILKTLVSQ